MYLLYLDDSGSPENSAESHFVLGGCAVHEQKLFWINQRMSDLTQKLVSRYPFSSAENLEFHASEIASGRKQWRVMKDKRERLQVVNEVLRIASDSRNDMKLFACAVQKRHYNPEAIVAYAFEDLCSRFQLFLQRQHAEQPDGYVNGLIIVDKSKHETTLQGLAKNFRTLGTRWGATTSQIQEVPLFVDSRASRGIQLADHIAYSIFQHYVHDDSSYFDIISSRFDADNNGRIHGLCHKTQDYACTCLCCTQKKPE